MLEKRNDEFDTGEAQGVLPENRQVDREEVMGVTVFSRRADGTISEGVVQDASNGGLRISGDTSGLDSGDALELTLVVQGQKVRYACEVRHVNATEGCYGVRYTSGPMPEAQQLVEKRCTNCRRNFDPACRYCSHCGQRLVIR